MASPESYKEAYLEQLALTKGLEQLISRQNSEIDYLKYRLELQTEHNAQLIRDVTRLSEFEYMYNSCSK